MARGLKVHTRESVRKSRSSGISAEERDEKDRKALSRWAAKCRDEGPLLFRSWKGDWVLPDKLLETKKPTSSK